MNFAHLKLAKPLNVALIGSGHYSTGQTALSNEVSTDKDFGVLLPSLFYLRKLGKVNEITLCGRDGSKFEAIKEKIRPWGGGLGLNVNFNSYPDPGRVDEKAYLSVLDDLSRPCAAIIAVPDDLHVEVMLACAQRDIPFLIVKPAVTRLADFYRVKSVMPDGLLGMVDYHKVYDEANLSIRSDIEEGAYGRLHHVSSLMTQRRDMVRIYERWLRSSPGTNVNHYLGSHYIHMTGFLTGATPLDVRATQQFGFIERLYKIKVADTIQTHIRWRARDGCCFTSYHVSGWADPSQTESMTYQEIHILSENGHVFSDQRFRGTRKVLVGTGSQVPNPYFFGLSQGLLGHWGLETKYGYQSVANFIDLAITGTDEHRRFKLPTFEDSEYVTAILEAADMSLSRDSKVISITSHNGRLELTVTN